KITKVIGTILGSAIGDALGAPLEIYTKEFIAENFPNFKENGVYVDCLPDSSRKKDGHQKGQWTDDTQLMLPMLDAYLEDECFNPNTIANKYLTEFLKGPRGWGRSTIKAVENLAISESWMHSADHGLGIGNGAAMKAAPLGIYLGLAFEKNKLNLINDAINTIINVAKITHKKEGIIGGAIQAMAIACVIQNKEDILINYIGKLESDYFNSSLYTDKIKTLMDLGSIEEICEAGGCSSKAFDSVPSVIASYLLHDKHRPFDSVFDIIKCGGDTDTTAAMLGSLIGAKYGLAALPDNLLNELEDSQKIIRLANLFADKLGVHDL